MVFFPTAIRHGSTAERSSYLYNHAQGSPAADDENIIMTSEWLTALKNQYEDDDKKVDANCLA